MDLGAVRFFVLDEADRLVDQEGLELVMQLFSALPKGGSGTARLQVLSHKLSLVMQLLDALLSLGLGLLASRCYHTNCRWSCSCFMPCSSLGPGRPAPGATPQQLDLQEAVMFVGACSDPCWCGS